MLTEAEWVAAETRRPDKVYLDATLGPWWTDQVGRWGVALVAGSAIGLAALWRHLIFDYPGGPGAFFSMIWG